MSISAFHVAVKSLPYGKRLPTAVYILDPGNDSLPHFLRTTCATLRERLELGEEFNILTIDVIKKALGLPLEPGEEKVEKAHKQKGRP